MTAIRSDLVDAPYVKGFPLILKCLLVNTIDLEIHTQFIGKIMDVGDYVLLVLSKVNPLTYSWPELKYYAIGEYFGKHDIIHKW